MNSTILVKAVQQICGGCGYDFRIYSKEHPPLVTTQRAVALLEVPQFRSIEGSKHGRITYRVSLRLLHRAINLTTEAKSQIISQAETDALNIFTELSSKDGIAIVKNLQFDPLTLAMPHCSAGTIATADIVTIF